MFTVQGTCALNRPTSAAKRKSNPASMCSPSRWRGHRSATPLPRASLRTAVIGGFPRAGVDLQPAADPFVVQSPGADRRAAAGNRIAIDTRRLVRLAALVVVRHLPGHAEIPALDPPRIAPARAIVAPRSLAACQVRAAAHSRVSALGGARGGYGQGRQHRREDGLPPRHARERSGDGVELAAVHHLRSRGGFGAGSGAGFGRLPTGSNRTLTRSRHPQP
jgi:hypothetical protein